MVEGVCGDEESSRDLGVFSWGKRATRGATETAFCEAKAACVAFEIEVDVAGFEEDLDAAVLPAGVSIVGASASEAGFGFVDVETKLQDIAKILAIDRDVGLNGLWVPMILRFECDCCHR